ncbi:MAG: trypsin-like peptidase domain-containing protein [Burkholderiaceae bacterium]|nr:trypsin-like peptidase domain-containing protein [Burkholderiaceae bacterium]
MLRKLWLTFAQAVVIVLAVLFVVAIVRPQWLSISPWPAWWPATRMAQSGNERHDAILSYSGAAQRAIPSVVNIFTSKALEEPDGETGDDPRFRRFFGEQFAQPQPTFSLGSGVIVASDGLILTNHHVVASADEIEVLLSDGRRTRAGVVGSDPDTDLAVLRVAMLDLPAIAFGKSEDARVGDVVLAIGNPFGVGQTVTMGIISALGRSQLGINTFENFIQTDAAINPGNSGGALVDAEGRLLGINTAIYSPSGGSLGIGFATPASSALHVMEQLVRDGAVTRGFIGVEPQDLTPELAEAFQLPLTEGAVIAGLVRGGPAEKAGVRVGDILVAVNGLAVKNTTTMLDMIAKLAPGTTATFRFVRDNQRSDIRIVVGKRPRPQESRPR